MKKVIIPLTIDFDKSQIIGRIDLNEKVARQLTNKDMLFPKGTGRGKNFSIRQFSLKRKTQEDVSLDTDGVEGILQLLSYTLEINVVADYGPSKADMLNVDLKLRLPATAKGHTLLKLLKEIVTKNNGSILERTSHRKTNDKLDSVKDILYAHADKAI